MPSATTITAIEILPRDVPLREPFAIATGAQLRADVAIARVTLAGGAVGLGEAAPFPAVSGETRDRSAATMRAIAPSLEGHDAREHRLLAAAMAEGAPGEPAACAGIEMALLDALARAWGAPLWALWGGVGPRSFTTDLTITAGDGAHAAASAGEAARRGFDTLKIKVGARDPEEDAERVALVRAAAPGARLVLDANGGWSARQALAHLRLLRARGIEVAALEQPVAPDDLDGLAEVTRGSGATRVLADESARSATDVVRLVRLGAAHGINLKLTKTGVGEAVAMHAIARAAGLAIMIGGMVETEVAMGFSAQLVRGLGGIDYVDLDTPLFLDGRITDGGTPFSGPTIEVGDAPGLGCTLRG